MSMKDWLPILRRRLPRAQPELAPEHLLREHITGELVALVDQVWIWAQPDNPHADTIIEDAICRLIVHRETNPMGYRWARAALLGRFRV